ncbi:MAG: hypothetical protein ABSA85_14505 [Terracidiphilus sp.]|jgi:hypothetical protein
MIPVCRHIKTDGARCKANALRERPYCYYHDRLHRVLNKQNYPQKSLVLHPLEDRDSVFMALSDVVCGLAAGRIDTQNATRLIYGLQVAGKYAPDSANDVAKDAVKSVDFTNTGDELAPELSYCTNDDECDSCGHLDNCKLKKAQAWRAAHPLGDEDENAADEEEVEDDESDEGGDNGEEENQDEDADEVEDTAAEDANAA